MTTPRHKTAPTGRPSLSSTVEVLFGRPASTVKTCRLLRDRRRWCTTAYRYFPSQAALHAAAHPEVATTRLLPPSAPAAVTERLATVVDRVTEIVVDTEAQQRTMLRLSLDPGAGRQDTSYVEVSCPASPQKDPENAPDSGSREYP